MKTRVGYKYADVAEDKGSYAQFRTFQSQQKYMY